MERNGDIPEIVTFLHDYDIKTIKEDDSIDEIISTILEKSNPDSAFYIVDISSVISQYQRWIKELPNIRPYYAIKCNPNNSIIKLLSRLGTGFDCASRNEISQVLNLKIPAEDIIYANPVKGSSQLRYARAVDVDRMTFDDVDELNKIVLYHPHARLVLRIKIDDTGSACRFGCKFGADLAKLDKIFMKAKVLELNIIGVSFHVGSNCGSVETYYKAIRDARFTFDKAKEHGFKLTLLDIGGGFPGDLPLTDDNTDSDNQSPDSDTCDNQHTTQITFEESAKRIREALEEFFNPDIFPDLQIISEPGRFFVSASHTLILNIEGRKVDIDSQTGEKRFTYYLNDGIYGSFNCIVNDHAKPVIVPYNERDGKLYKSVVFGPTCDSVDKISDECLLPDLAIGECVYVENFGAYTTAAASTFNGFQLVPCYYVLRT